MAPLLALSRQIDRLNEGLGRLIVWLVLTAVLISAGNAIVLKAFNMGSSAFLEIQCYLFAAVFFTITRLIIMNDRGWSLLHRAGVRGEVSHNAGGLIR